MKKCKLVLPIFIIRSIYVYENNMKREGAMRNLPLIPYETLKELIRGSYTSKQINYFIHLCKMCNSNGIIEEKNINIILEKALNKDKYLFSRASGYRAMAHFTKSNILFTNDDGHLEIKGYEKSFKKGSKD